MFWTSEYRASLSIIPEFLPPELAWEVPSVLYLALELFDEKIGTHENPWHCRFSLSRHIKLNLRSIFTGAIIYNCISEECKIIQHMYYYY